MKRLHLTLPSPAENLACDEGLLDWCEAGHGDEVLRFWESPEPFVVVGYANKVSTEADVDACNANQIPILRRCSGGGTVVQGPGCLNYALVLSLTGRSTLHSISATNQSIMERHRSALESLLGRRVVISGHTDLVVDGLKFSGNSQRRRKRFVLFHGTFLLNFDLTLISKLLPLPSKQPAYRAGRTHDEFLTNLGVSRDKLEAVLARFWNARDELSNAPFDHIAELARSKYGTREWNFRL